MPPRRVARLIQASIPLIGGLLAVFAPAGARADPADADAGASDVAAATALFDEGRRLVAEHRLAEACRAFEASLALAPQLGVRLNLGDCYEQAGKPASAWLTFVEAAAIARQRADPRGGYARARIAALIPRLSRLTITVPARAAVAGLEVRRDGARLPASVYGVAIPVDPGEHAVTATAPGAIAWSTRVAVGSDGGAITVEVPTLAVSPALDAPRAGDLRAGSPGSPGSRRRLATWLVTGAGVAGMGAAAYFAVSAWSAWRHARPGCDPQGRCGATSYDDAARAHHAGDLATGAFALGGAALVTGLVLHVTRPRAPERAIRIGATAAADHAGVVVAGGF